MQYRNEIDGLRALAVIPVILFHAGFTTFGGGYVGVDVFFVISGYLITSIIIKELDAGSFSIVTFYERRARRILPALFVVMIACLPFAVAWMAPYQLREFANSIAAVTLFSSNFLFWQEAGYFAAAAEEKPLLHTWSLAVEEQFYVLFPLLLILIWRYRRSCLTYALVVVGVLSLALAEWGWRNYPDANFFLAPTRAWELMAGALCAVYLARKAPGSRVLSQGFSIVGFSMIILAIAAFDEQTPFPSVYALVPTIGTALIVLFAVKDTFIAQILSTKPLVWIGLISYSAYLWHQPLFAFARILSYEPPRPYVFILLSLLTFLLAYLSWRYVEAVFRDRRGRVTRSAVFRSAAVCSTAMLALALAGNLSNGFIQRYDPKDQYLANLSPYVEQGYVVRRANGLNKLQAFGEARSKILVIGDSYAQDFINVLYESADLSTVSIVVKLINPRCGVLLTENNYEEHIAAEDRATCSRSLGFNDPRLVSLLPEADLVVVASSWKLWQVRYLRETIDNLRSLGATNVVVLGRKAFGRIRANELIKLSDDQKRTATNYVGESHLQTCSAMRDVLPEKEYIDFQSIVCQSEDTCPTFTPELKLISFDGGHLTKAGARYVGARLLTDSHLSYLLEDSAGAAAMRGDDD